jgi:hypothetical protein
MFERTFEANCLKVVDRLWELDGGNCWPETVHANVYEIAVGPTVTITQLVANCLNRQHDVQIIHENNIRLGQLEGTTLPPSNHLRTP